jgi:CDP-diacylglycerol--inositol 3-phosphatidyltransferase
MASKSYYLINSQYQMVFLFIPNIIGYLRFAALFATFFTYRTQPGLTVLLYGVSQALDAFDGMAARKFNQSTRFGAVLDMVCDRASNAVLLAILADLHPTYSWVFLSDIVLDLVSHWYQMYVSLLKGAHHK